MSRIYEEENNLLSAIPWKNHGPAWCSLFLMYHIKDDRKTLLVSMVFFVYCSHPWAKTLAKNFRVLIDEYGSKIDANPNQPNPVKLLVTPCFILVLFIRWVLVLLDRFFFWTKKTCFQGKVVRKIIFRVPHLSKHQLTLFLPKNKLPKKNISAFLKNTTQKKDKHRTHWNPCMVYLPT